MGGITDLTLDKEDLSVLEEEKVILTLRCLQELDIFSLSPGMYGRTKVFLSSEMASEVATNALIVLGTLDRMLEVL